VFDHATRTCTRPIEHVDKRVLLAGKRHVPQHLDRVQGHLIHFVANTFIHKAADGEGSCALASSSAGFQDVLLNCVLSQLATGRCAKSSRGVLHRPLAVPGNVL
jgi:hypothetical protein